MHTTVYIGFPTLLTLMVLVNFHRPLTWRFFWSTLADYTNCIRVHSVLGTLYMNCMGTVLITIVQFSNVPLHLYTCTSRCTVYTAVVNTGTIVIHRRDKVQRLHRLLHKIWPLIWPLNYKLWVIFHDISILLKCYGILWSSLLYHLINVCLN